MLRYCCRLVLLTFLICINVYRPANAFFTEDYKKKMLYGTFKKHNNADIYIGVRAGFLIKTWTPNIITMISSNADYTSEYLTQIPNDITKKTSGNYTYSIGVDFGLHMDGSNFRHEFNFEWYGFSSEPINLTGLTADVNGTNYDYNSLSGRLVAKLGTYADVYRLEYGISYNFENAFKMMDTNWDIFVGIGAGIAIINGGTYIGGEIAEAVSVRENVDDDGNAQQQILRTYAYEENEVHFSTDASKYRLHKTKAFAVAYHGKIGILANISQSFAATIGVSFGATSRPLFTTKFKYIDKNNGMRSHLEYHVALEIGMLLKAFSIAI